MGGKSGWLFDVREFFCFFLFSFFPDGRGTLLHVSPITAGPL